MNSLPSSVRLSKAFRPLLATLLCGGLSFTVGCVADADIDEDDMLGEAAGEIRINYASGNTLPAKGGPGGNAYPDVICPLGYVATGLNLRTGDWVDNIQMTCKFLYDDDTFGAAGTTNPQGGTGGSPVSGNCPTGQILVGQITGTNGPDNAPGTYVRQLGGHCAFLSRILAKKSGYDSTIVPMGSQGTVSESDCGPGQVVVGFAGRSGWWTDQVGFICRTLLSPYAPSSVSTTNGSPITMSNVSLNGSGTNFINVSPGAPVTVAANYSITQMASCPGCIDQILIGLAPNDPKKCMYNGIPSLSGTSGLGSVSFTAPTVPGLYPIRFRYGMAYSCDLGWWNVDSTPTNATNIGYINVY